MTKIFLIGMPGSGKSTIGKLLANELGYTFIDFDAEIEGTEGATIKAIFELKGEAYFRQIEAQLLTRISGKEGNFVLATGGGTPCYYNGLALMNKVGKTVFINVSQAVLVNRLKTDTQRPILQEGVESKIQELYKNRMSIYTKAKIVVEADQLSTQEIVERIKKEL